MKPVSLLRHWPFVFLLVLRYALPLWLTGSIAASSHDNLDSEVVYSAVLGRFWAGSGDSAALSVFLAGQLDWSDFARSLHPLTLLYAVLPPVWAYALTDVALLALAYGGFLALMPVLRLPQSTLLACLAAFGMSYTSYGAGLAGLPLLLALIWRQGPIRPWEWLVVAALAVNSAFALHALFAPVAALGLALMLGRWPRWDRVFGLGGVFLALSLAAAAGLVVQALTGGESHRADWVYPLPGNPLGDWVTGTLANLLSMGSAYHSVITPALHVPVIVITALLAGGSARRGALVLCGFVALAVAADVAMPWAVAYLPGALGSIQWDRFLLFAPILSLVLGAMALGRAVRVAAGLSLALAVVAGMGVNLAMLERATPEPVLRQIKDTLKRGETALAVRQVLSGLMGLRGADLMRAIETWDRHFRPADYACLRAALEGDADNARRVLSFGPDPMIAPFHGLEAIDGYHNYYPLAYKRAFRPVIAPVLEHDANLAAYFDEWGSRVGTLAGRVGPLPEGIGPDWLAAAALGANHVIADRPAEGLTELANCNGLRLYRIAPTSDMAR